MIMATEACFARPEDWGRFQQLVSAKTYADNPVTGLSGERRRQLLLTSYREGWEKSLTDPNLAFLLCPDAPGFVVAHAGEFDSLTGHHQARIWDWSGHPSAWLGALESWARLRQAQYLVVPVPAQSPNPFSEQGFRPELTRVIKRIESQSSQGPFSLRLASPKDLMFIAGLNSQGMSFYLPANRGLDPGQVAERNLQHYLGMNLGPDSDMVGFIIQEGRRPFGYLLVKLGIEIEFADRSAYLYDVSLKPEAWSKGAGRILGNYAQAWLAERGYRYLVGDISCVNHRTLQVATAAIGFQAEWERWGKAL